jgi:hypothetical protein
MAVFRQYIAPLLVVLVFLLALVAVSARIFLPDDMAAPAPIEDISFNAAQRLSLPSTADALAANAPSLLDALVHGLPDESTIAPL